MRAEYLVQRFAVVVPNARVIVFALFISGYVNVSAEPPVVRHVPFIAKHPVVKFIPFANVDDAIVEVTFIKLVSILRFDCLHLFCYQE